jgi:arylsulfatase A-like enzyme
MQATDKYLQRFANIEDKNRRTYAAMMSAMDDAIGQVLAKLRQQKQEENTLIFFFSDNGGPTGVNHSSNQPLRGNKATTWEGGVRVPYLVQWKGKLPAGKVYDQPVIQLDILPTALAAAGVAVSPEWNLDGVNLLPYFRGETSGAPHDALYWRFGAQMAIRRGDWKLVKAPVADGARGARRTGALALDRAMLFNVANDIGEQNDVAESNPEKVKELTALWKTWNEELKDPQWRVARAADAKNTNKKKKQN